MCSISERMRQLEVIMDYDCRRLMDVVVELGRPIEFQNIVDDYKEKKAEYEKLKSEFEQEFLLDDNYSRSLSQQGN